MNAVISRFSSAVILGTSCLAMMACSGGTTAASPLTTSTSDPVTTPTTDPVPTPVSGAFQESGGIVVMEAESTTSPFGLWILDDDIADFTGSGHIEFTGNTVNNGDPASPLSYTFTINTSGTYRLMIRAGKTPPAGTRDDQANDCYVRVEGDYASGDPDIPVSVLRTDTKMYGANDHAWSRWSQNLDDHDNIRGQYAAPQYQFTAGQTYTFVMSGRSQTYNADRIVFYETSLWRGGDARATTVPQSTTTKPVVGDG